MNKEFSLMDDLKQSEYNYVWQKVKNILQRILEIEKEKEKEDISLDSNLTEYGLNSMTFIQLVVAIEAELECEFDDEDLDVNKFWTARSIVDYVVGKTNLSNDFCELKEDSSL
jgi:acyl carrier protein